MHAYGRGSRGAAISLARAPGARAEALAMFSNAAYSANSRKPRAARKQLLVDVARAAGIPDPCHLTPEAIRIVVAVLHAAGY
eukprot:15128887-Alexandrium_andersonii.AAC.1